MLETAYQGSGCKAAVTTTLPQQKIATKTSLSRWLP